MKTITTLTAVAALIAGISVASAQSMNSPSPSGSSGKQAAGSGKFCIEVSKGSGSVQCKYASMTACEKDAQAQGLQCSPNPNSGTTGSKN
jgi:exo-beta-1,3-glucanase (GH17 family)